MFLLLCFVIVFTVCFFCFFFFNDTATTEIYTLSLHDALPISIAGLFASPSTSATSLFTPVSCGTPIQDRKSTRLNSSHQIISYAVFCLKKKKKKEKQSRQLKQKKYRN